MLGRDPFHLSDIPLIYFCNSFSRAELLQKSNVHTVFLALELLDNLAHDKVRRCTKSRKLEQATVKSSSGAEDDEVFGPLDDKLLSNTLLKVPSYAGSAGRPVWVPTVACGVLNQIRLSRPITSVALADFDWLPAADIVEDDGDSRRSISADGEPLVTDMNGIDHSCYLMSPNLCDILYPTDFSKLSTFSKKTFDNNHHVRTFKQSRFLMEYGNKQVEESQSRWTGYSPMIHDFGNCSVLTVTLP